jgi:hypothetical protein
MFITYCATILREEVKVGMNELDFQRHVTAKVFIARQQFTHKLLVNLVLCFFLRTANKHTQNFRTQPSRHHVGFHRTVGL